MTATPKSQIAPRPTVCGICRGELELARRGGGSGHEPSAFSPSCHRIGEHGDFYRCRRCGTVHQPSLPRGSALYDIYRAVSDERYMVEERGRRRTARRLLDRLGKYVPEGRLLQIGCGYGLLLDEARRRGYEVEGVEPSVEAASYAREHLGLPVREMAFEEADLQGARYDGILLVDVLEHLSDPRAALDRLRDLLAPDGALLIVTPDPSSLTARLAGANWWCYVPAHSCLIPRKTLRQLLVVRDLVVVEDVASVHSFTPGYWLAGLGERGGRVGRAITQVAARLPRSVLLTASLRDERVLLARDAQTPRPYGRRCRPGDCA
jgi:2-polyprenyl-3-methyl-5-hydroxy-6-metoxy-1,4-benzoquinol methylase